MGRIIVSLALGVPSIFVFILGAEPFEARGMTSVREIAAGCITLALYLAVTQFLVARKSGHTLRSDWPLAVAMAVPLLAEFFLVVAVEKHTVVIRQAIPMLVAGSIGLLVGTLLAHRNRRSAAIVARRAVP